MSTTGQPERFRAAILGVGQLGGSFSLAGRAAGLFASVVGFGRNPDSLRRARSLGLCDRTSQSATEAVEDANLVLLAVPLRAIASLVDSIAPAVRAGALVIDVGSVKATTVRDIETRLPAHADFVGCHPLAGTEQFGPEAAREDLFRGRKCVVCPTFRTRPGAVERTRVVWEALGAEVSVMDPAKHDEVMAAISHLPHAAAYSLTAALATLNPEIAVAASQLPTTSLRDTSRVAASSPVMWTDIFLENRAALLPLIRALGQQVRVLEEAIEAGDDAGVANFLETGRAARARLLPE